MCLNPTIAALYMIMVVFGLSLMALFVDERLWTPTLALAFIAFVALLLGWIDSKKPMGHEQRIH